MKKFSVLIALVLLAVAGTGYAVTCSYDNVPAATLLVPYFKVSLNGATDYPIPSGGTDTLVSVVNVSTPGVIAHVTVWNKYSKAVIDFNLPLTGKDTVSFSMRDILNGKLSPNLPQYDTSKYPVDPCGLVNPGKPNATYQPSVGWGQTQFIRFSHPEAINLTTDVIRSISQYNLTAVDAIGALFRPTVWDSLDESGDITSWTTSKGANILDVDNPQCGWSNGTDSVYKDALSGYLTIDVVNYCTNYFPDQAQFYNEDAIATDRLGRDVHPERPHRRHLLRGHGCQRRQHLRRPGRCPRVRLASPLHGHDQDLLRQVRRHDGDHGLRERGYGRLRRGPVLRPRELRVPRRRPRAPRRPLRLPLPGRREPAASSPGSRSGAATSTAARWSTSAAGRTPPSNKGAAGSGLL